MDSTPATNFWHKGPRSACNEDHYDYSISRIRTEEEKLRRRQKWLWQQECERQHEKLRQQKILKYERKRAQALKLAEQKSLRQCRNRSRSRSDSSSSLHWHEERFASNASKSGILYEKLDGSSSGGSLISLFKGSQGIRIDTKELHRIKVKICRDNIPADPNGFVSELQRDIINPEDVILKRKKDIVQIVESTNRKISWNLHVEDY